MTSSGLLAYANARMHAAKSRLLTRRDAAPLITAADALAVQRALAALEIDNPLQRLVRVYQIAIHGYRGAGPLLRALFARHEIENVKLLWRLTARHGQRNALSRLWLDLGALATVSLVEASSPRELAEQLAHTPYARIATTVARVHGSDVAAAELALDRWVSQRLFDEARRLHSRESLSRRLVELVIRERDAELVRRGATWYGLTSVSGDVEVVAVMRQERLRLCRRAFVGNPFLLAPAVAVILLAEEELRAVQALIERGGEASLDAPMTRALAGSQLGSWSGG